MPAGYSDFPTKVFVDSNVILECKPLPELPWADLSRPGPILVLLLPQVTKEVDSKKQDGRLAPRARAFNKLCVPATLTDTPVEIVSAPVSVALTIADCSKIPWENYSDLDRDDADSLVVAQALHTRGLAASEAIFVSHDIGALVRARRRGLETFHVPDTWLRRAEMSPQERKIESLKQEVNVLRKTMPELEIDVELAAGPHEVFRVEPLNDGELGDYSDAVTAKFPHEVQQRELLGIGFYDHGYDQKYDKFRSVSIPRLARRIHTQLELQFNQVPISFSISNDGEVMASDVQVAVRVTGGWLNDKPVLAKVVPTAPRVNTDRFMTPVGLNRAPDLGGRVRKLSNASLDIGALRHTQEFTWTGVIWLDPTVDSGAHLEFRATASNLIGSVIRHVSVATRMSQVRAVELFDLDDLVLIQEPRVQRLLKEAWSAKCFDDIEIEGVAER